MLAILTFIALTSFSNYEIQNVGYAQDRCANTECLAEVRFSSKAKKKIKVSRENYRKSIFFEENDSLINSFRENQIQIFLEQHPKNNNFTVVGYADGCGSHGYNQALSEKRASNIARKIRQHRPSARVSIKWGGENSVGHSAAAKRVDIILTEKILYVEPFPEVVADFYLLDASGSMAGNTWNKWVDIISYHKPVGSKVYVSTTNYVANNSNIKNIIPRGATEIWYSYWSIIDKMQPGQTLAIISDFDSQVKLSSRESEMIKQKVASKRIRVLAYRSN